MKSKKQTKPAWHGQMDPTAWGIIIRCDDSLQEAREALHAHISAWPGWSSPPQWGAIQQPQEAKKQWWKFW